MKQGVEEMKRKYLDESKPDQTVPHTNDLVLDTNDLVLENTNTATQVKTEDKEIQKKVHKKKRSSRKRLSINEEKKQNPDSHVSLFDMEDVSTDDEELANLPEMPPLGKTVFPQLILLDLFGQNKKFQIFGTSINSDRAIKVFSDHFRYTPIFINT